MRIHKFFAGTVLMPALVQFFPLSRAITFASPVGYQIHIAAMRTVHRHRRRVRLALQALAVAALNCSIGVRAWSQTAPSSTTTGSSIAVTPTVSGGWSVLEWDYGGDDAFPGWVARGGAELGPFADLTLGVEHWPDLRPYGGGWSYQLEASLYPLGRPRVAPYLLFGIGHFDASLPPGGIYTGQVTGRATALALGLEARVWGGMGVRLEGVVRSDAGAGDDQFRALVTYAPRNGGWDGTSRLGAGAMYGMVRLSGPWHSVGPGYGLNFATGVSERDAVALTLVVLHWQIPPPQGYLAPYLWDTRAVLVMPAWRRGPQRGKARWYVQAGPALDVMVEGPDFGLRGGVNAEVGGSLRFGPVPGLTGGIGWVWIMRGVSNDPNVPPTDERGLLFHAGITF